MTYAEKCKNNFIKRLEGFQRQEEFYKNKIKNTTDKEYKEYLQEELEEVYEEIEVLKIKLNR